MRNQGAKETEIAAILKGDICPSAQQAFALGTILAKRDAASTTPFAELLRFGYIPDYVGLLATFTALLVDHGQPVETVAGVALISPYLAFGTTPADYAPANRNVRRLTSIYNAPLIAAELERARTQAILLNKMPREALIEIARLWFSPKRPRAVELFEVLRDKAADLVAALMLCATFDTTADEQEREQAERKIIGQTYAWVKERLTLAIPCPLIDPPPSARRNPLDEAMRVVRRKLVRDAYIETLEEVRRNPPMGVSQADVENAFDPVLRPDDRDTNPICAARRRRIIDYVFERTREKIQRDA